MFLLDTNVCIHILNGTAPGLRERFIRYGAVRIRVCSVVKAELYAGAYRSSRQEENLNKLSVFFSPLQSYSFDDAAAEHYGRIFADLARRGSLIGPNDLKIGAIARANDLVLVTHNTREFSRIPGLRLEDWEVHSAEEVVREDRDERR